VDTGRTGASVRPPPDAHHVPRVKSGGEASYGATAPLPAPFGLARLRLIVSEWLSFPVRGPPSPSLATAAASPPGRAANLVVEPSRIPVAGAVVSPAPDGAPATARLSYPPCWQDMLLQMSRRCCCR